MCRRAKKYVFLGAVGDDADLDITVEDSRGRIVAKNTKTDNLPIVQFTPRTSGNSVIRLKLYSASSALFCGMVLLREGGWDLPTDNIAQSTAEMLQRCSAVAGQTPARFLQQEGEWAVIGRVMRGGDRATYSENKYGSGRRCIVTGSDSHVRDTDLKVTEEQGRGMLDEDTLSDNNLILDFQSRSGRDCSLELINADSSGPSIIMTAVLDID